MRLCLPLLRVTLAASAGLFVFGLCLGLSFTYVSFEATDHLVSMFLPGRLDCAPGLIGHNDECLPSKSVRLHNAPYSRLHRQLAATIYQVGNRVVPMLACAAPLVVLPVGWAALWLYRWASGDEDSNLGTRISERR